MADESPVYKLIHAVDPTKVNVPIKQRFAKLTLSSNKKKNDNMNEDGDVKQRDAHEVEKRQSASRNLLDLLTASQGHAGESARPKSNNPLLQSDSSSKSSSAAKLDDETQVDILEEQLGNEPMAAELSELVMEHLQMSEDECSLLTEESEQDANLRIEDAKKNDDEISRQIAALSQQVSTLTVSSKPTMISGTTTSHERTQLVSTESQKMSSSDEPLRPTQMPPKIKLEKVAPPPALEYSEISITVPTTSEDEEDETETESAITVSDATSDDEAASVSITDYDAITSIIPVSGETADALLPSTFSNDKADRMEAFLRDVSQELRERQTASHEDTTIGETETPEDAELNVTPDAQMLRAQELRTADTESMCSDKDEVSDLAMPPKPTDRERRLLALNDTMPMSQSHSSIFNTSAMPKTPHAAPASNRHRTEDEEAKRLAHDETEANTLASSAWNNSNNSFATQSSTLNESHSLTPHNSWQRSGAAAAAEDSIVISETSSEDEQSSAIILPKTTNKSTPAAKAPTPRTPTFKTPTSRRPTPKTPTSRTRRTPKRPNTPPASSNEIVISENPATSDGSTSPYESQLSQIQMSMGSINISAKINIKIHISQQISTDEEEEEQLSSDKGDDDDDNDDNKRNKTPPSLRSTEDNSNASEKIDKAVVAQKQKSPSKTNVSVMEIADDIEAEEEAPAEDGAFLTHAEKLLNQLYGKAWQTPDVIKTLKRTSANERTSAIRNKSPATAGKPASTKNSKIKEKPTAAPPNAAGAVEESILMDDFSIFRRNIVRTNLDSTRLVTPKQSKGTHRVTATNTEPRRQASAAQNRKEVNSAFKVPQTEVKKRPTPAVLTTKTGRVVKPLHRPNIVDSDSDDSCVNASDDSDADRTRVTDISTSSNDSWKNDDDSENDSDLEIAKPAKPTRNVKRQTETAKEKTRRPDNKQLLDSKEDLIYLDLSQNEVSVLEREPNSPPANHDPAFSKRLQDILRTCRPGDKPKLEATPKTITKPKRKLFNANNIYDDDDENLEPPSSKPDTPKQKTNTRPYEEIIDIATPSRKGTPIFNRPLEAIKNTKTPRSTGKAKRAAPETPKSAVVKGHANLIKDLQVPEYSFLKSLEAHLVKSRCHPEAVAYRENYRQKKEELAEKLYKLFNEKIFDNRLNVPLTWNKKLQSTAGRCLNRKKLSIHSSTIELSEKVLSSADRLRCTLVHELCHAATWTLNLKNDGHGPMWKEWARKSNQVFPELPKIGVCHNYEIEYKYTYKCTLCAAKSHAHSKSKKVENIRCSYCYGSIEIFLNKKDKDGNILPTPVREPTGFAKFVKDNYKQHKRDDRKHADIMKLLSNEFAALKVAGSAN